MNIRLLIRKFVKEDLTSGGKFIVAGVLIAMFFGAGVGNANAQCHPVIDTMSVVVSSTQTIDGGFDPIWVCPNDTLISDGGFHNIYLEHGAVMMTGGGIDTIYVKGGASFSMYGGIHVIFYVADSDLLSLGGIPTLFLCDSLTFDYSEAPEGGCIPTGVTALKWNRDESLVYPDPVTTKINFDLTNYHDGNYRVEIYNACGKRITQETISQAVNSVDAENFNSGIYFYTLHDKDEIKARGKFIVE